jgi:hypothetical protein
LHKPLNRLRIRFAFGGEHALCQAFWRVIIEDGHNPLRDDGTVIVFVIGEMNGTTGYLHSSLQGGTMDRQAVIPLAAKGWDQGRMDVQNSMAEIVGDVYQLEEAGQTNKIHAGVSAVREYAITKVFARGTRFTLNDQSRDTGLSSTGQSERIGFAGDDDGDFRAQQSIGDAVYEVSQSCAAAAEQHGQPDGIVHEALVIACAAAIGCRSLVLA